jgi:predicted Zn-dependent protease
MPHRALIAAILALALTLGALPARAMSLIRDAEIERTLGLIADPILRAAGLNPARVRIYIVDSPELNAFVAGGDNLFLHTGLLARLDSVDALRAVIAHEVGHIAGGHVARRDQALAGARGVAGIGMALAAAAAIGSPEAAVAIATTTSQAAHRSALAHSRSEEASADQAGLRYMAAIGADPAAILAVMKLFRGQEALHVGRQDPYARTHPMWSERISLLERGVAALPPGGSPPEEDAYWHRRMVAKLDGFLDAPGRTISRYPEGDDSQPAMLARAVAYHRLPDIQRSTAAADMLIAARPDDPYYHELRGQFLLESGRAGPAVESYRRAVELAPDAPLILGGLGRALLNLDDPDADAEARDVLVRSATADPANPAVLRDLALAHARLGDEGRAALATAERYALTGEFEDAYRNAARAAALLPTGTPAWRQAQDIITTARRALN